jgi:CDP-paratose 2-epimerase
LGILQWFHLGDYQKVEDTISKLKEIKIGHLRTGISWADYHTKEGEKWYDWLMPRLAKEFTVLPCFLYTPPSIGIQHKISSPPKGAKLFADFLDLFINRHGQYFEWVELWNEPNNQSEYDYTLDADWNIFSEMIILSSHWAKKLGKKVALGGMSPIDVNWLYHMAYKHVLDQVDAIGIHGFPGSFDSKFLGWEYYISQVKAVLEDHNLTSEIWISEAGFSTWQYDEKQQVLEFQKAISSQVSRVYWYSLYDLDPSLPTVDGFHLDDREYYFGLLSPTGKPKLLYRILKEIGIDAMQNLQWLKEPTLKSQTLQTDRTVLITGGAGFIGINMAEFLLKMGYQVIIYDNLSRKGVEKNLDWLLNEYPNQDIRVEIADVRNPYKLRKAVEQSCAVFHFAAQVAVTTSLEEPNEDLEINVRGTFNVLEAIRRSAHKPPLFFTSTNKVYGDLADIELEEGEFRYFIQGEKGAQAGISENQPLNFHSPYGSSKGAADQYVLDYSRSYGIKAVVFRMSCIYGPHQFGTEDQGWVAHFLIQSLRNNPIQIYGNGKQVRDILFVQDLMNAFLKAWENIDEVSWQCI